MEARNYTLKGKPNVKTIESVDQIDLCLNDKPLNDFLGLNQIGVKNVADLKKIFYDFANTIRQKAEANVARAKADTEKKIKSVKTNVQGTKVFTDIDVEYDENHDVSFSVRLAAQYDQHAELIGDILDELARQQNLVSARAKRKLNAK